jgi:hypothetical protein
VALMALSMDEQRVLAEIERRLSAEEPRLAASMTSFRRPRPSVALRSPRARILGSLFTVMVVAMISLMVYAMIPFRAGHGARTPAGTARSPGQTLVTASKNNAPGSVTITAAPVAGAAKAAVTHTSAAGATGVTAHASTAHANTTHANTTQASTAHASTAHDSAAPTKGANAKSDKSG